MTTQGESNKSHMLMAFAAGVAAGVAVYKFWPQISSAVKPYATGASRFVKQRLGVGPERFSDVIEEMKKEESGKSG